MHRAGAVGGADAGGHALGRFNRYRKGGAVHRAIARGHGGSFKIAALACQRQANQATAKAGHEVDGLGRDVVGCEHQVAFVSRSPRQRGMTMRPARISATISATGETGTGSGWSWRVSLGPGWRAPCRFHGRMRPGQRTCAMQRCRKGAVRTAGVCRQREILVQPMCWRGFMVSAAACIQPSRSSTTSGGRIGHAVAARSPGLFSSGDRPDSRWRSTRCLRAAAPGRCGKCRCGRSWPVNAARPACSSGWSPRHRIGRCCRAGGRCTAGASGVLMV